MDVSREMVHIKRVHSVMPRSEKKTIAPARLLGLRHGEPQAAGMDAQQSHALGQKKRRSFAALLLAAGDVGR